MRHICITCTYISCITHTYITFIRIICMYISNIRDICKHTPTCNEKPVDQHPPLSRGEEGVNPGGGGNTAHSARIFSRADSLRASIMLKNHGFFWFFLNELKKNTQQEHNKTFSDAKRQGRRFWVPQVPRHPSRYTKPTLVQHPAPKVIQSHASGGCVI